ncbi:MAG: type II toxin-antitoxin system VapC family toxin [Hormoscilla sp. GUM202]|nr:type II toxin-antitoxin system VapC family toxin [Hormoscilla sp. GUM202]
MLLDTSGLLCLQYQSEPSHVQACNFYSNASLRFVHNYILAEYVALANARRFPPLTAVRFVVDIVENPDIETVWVDEPLHREAINLLMARLDKSYSLCDAVSFVLMRQRGITEALTTDRHFEQEGFRRLLLP